MSRNIFALVAAVALIASAGAAFGGDGVTADRIYLGDNSDVEGRFASGLAGFGGGDGGTEAGGSASYDQHVMYKGFHFSVQVLLSVHPPHQALVKSWE